MQTRMASPSNSSPCSLLAQVADMRDGDSDVGKYQPARSMSALIAVRLEQDVVYTLNLLQAEGLEHPLLDPVKAIQFALSENEEGLEFLRSWNEGDWGSCARQWPEWLKTQP